MLAYVLRRIGIAIVLLWLVTTFTFILSHVIPGNPALAMAGLGATKAQIHALYIEMGLNRPLPEQYVTYMIGLLHFNFGRSARTGDLVTADLAHYLPATIELVFVSFALYVLIAVPLGAWAATHEGRITETAVRVGAIFGSAIPVFWLGALLQLIFFAHLGWLPEGGELAISQGGPPHYTGIYLIDSLLSGQWALFGQTLLHLVLPVATIVIAQLAVGLRSARASVLQELHRPYVRTAEAKGMTSQRLLWRHVMKNAMNPVISILGIQFGYLLGWVILVEVVFGWPGIGLYLYDSIQTLDYAPILANTIIISGTFIVVNLIADLIYPILDPRLRDVGLA